MALLKFFSSPHYACTLIHTVEHTQPGTYESSWTNADENTQARLSMNNGQMSLIANLWSLLLLLGLTFGPLYSFLGCWHVKHNFLLGKHKARFN